MDGSMPGFRRRSDSPVRKFFVTMLSAHPDTKAVLIRVTWDDQQAINTFGKLNNRLHELRAELDAKKVRERNRSIKHLSCTRMLPPKRSTFGRGLACVLNRRMIVRPLGRPLTLCYRSSLSLRPSTRTFASDNSS
eukprot:513964-Pyramimonas_sp.AAC.2